MSSSIPLLRLQDAWRECERNIYHLCGALTALAPVLPMTGKLFPAILQYLQEQYEERPMLDKLNRLEKLGYIQNAAIWQDLHNTRNKFAHDYPEDYEKNGALINVACEAAEEMYNMLMGIKKKLEIDYPALELGKPLPLVYPKPLEHYK